MRNRTPRRQPWREGRRPCTRRLTPRTVGLLANRNKKCICGWIDSEEHESQIECVDWNCRSIHRERERGRRGERARGPQEKPLQRRRRRRRRHRGHYFPLSLAESRLSNKHRSVVSPEQVSPLSLTSSQTATVVTDPILEHGRAQPFAVRLENQWREAEGHGRGSAMKAVA